MTAPAMDDIAFEPAELLAHLKAKALEPVPDVQPDRLPVSTIKLAPALFQPRGIETDPRHVQKLTSVVKGGKDLKPMEVIQVGPDVYLVDGHHRMEAYEQARRLEPVPVFYFTGTVEQAVLRAGQANCEDKLPMEHRDRMNYAWRLTLLGGYSKHEVCEASGASDRQVANMRKAKAKLGDQAFDLPVWLHAWKAYQGKAGVVLTDDEREAWIEEQANRVADGMARAFGNRLSRNVEITALAFHAYFGRKLPALVAELRSMVAADDWLEDDALADF